MAEAALAVGEILIEPLITGITYLLNYVLHYKKYIKDLREGLDNLESARKRRQEEVDRATYNAEDINEDVIKWLKDVERRDTEGKKVVEKYEKYRNCYFRGVNLNPLTRFRIAKKAENNKQEIEKLEQRNNFPSVSHPKLPAGIVTGNYKGPVYWMAPSRASLLEKISRALLDPNVRIVGIWGAPGVGKSILLKQLEKQVQERKVNYDFDEVTMAVVSRSPNWEKIQGDLGYRLGLQTKKENSTDQKAVPLRERLKQSIDKKRKVLLILDDIWEKIDLANLGIPFDNKYPDLKLLLTSTNEQVLKHKMGSKDNFHLDRLLKGEAMDLFKQIVGEGVTNQSELIEQWAEECSGLPVLISTVATAVKALDSSVWADTLNNLRRFNSLGIGKFIDKSLEFIYHQIKSEEAKSLFLLCGQIGHQIISIDDLVIYGMGLGILKGCHTIEEVREKVKLLLKNLCASCLLEDHNEGYVKLHDLISDAALSIASKIHTPLVIRNREMLTTCSNDDFGRCKSIALYLDDKMDKLPEGLICPILDMLLIYRKEQESTHLEIPDSYFKDFGELKVLGLSDLIITSLPPSIQFLHKLHSLCLDGVAIEDLTVIGNLKTLRSLTFRRSKISRLPREIGELTNLRLLNMEACHDLKVIVPNVLGRLIHLEELHLPLSFDKWDLEGISNASLTELNNMPSLSGLTICVPNAALVPCNMNFQQLVMYNIYIGNMWDKDVSGNARTTKLELDSRSSKMIFNKWLQVILKKTQQLHLCGWIGYEESVIELSKDGFPELKHIHVERCPSVQYIIPSNQLDPFLVLESLHLSYLSNLQKICGGDLHHVSLGHLKVITIRNCDELRNLFSFSLAKSLSRLEELEISDCLMVQEIITSNYGGRDGDNREILEFKSLRNLKLVDLQEFSSFCSKDGNSSFEFPDGSLVSFPRLESLILRKLPKLRNISHSQCPGNLQSLKSLELVGCNSLSYALDINLLQQLRKLESLTIEDCEFMEIIFDSEESNTREVIMNPPPQISLKVSKLPTLREIWNNNLREISSFLNLKKLEVSECGELEYLFSASMAESFKNISHISISSCDAMKEILLGEVHDQEIELSLLTHLSISKMAKLKMFSHANRQYRFPCLTELIISSCPEMRTFVSVNHGTEEFTNEDAARDEFFFNKKVILPKLEKLVLHSLESMTSIWDDDNHANESFSKLASIEIKACEKIRSLFHPHFMERLQKLTKIHVDECNSLEALMRRQSSEEVVLSFSSLRDICVKQCDNLINIFPNAEAKTLSKIVSICISSCQRLEEVVSFDGDEALRFYNLSSLQLENLESLVHFCSGHYELYFPLLRKLTIDQCQKLRAFVVRPSNSARPKKQSPQLRSTRNIDVGGPPLFDEKVMFPSLEHLEIGGLEVKEIWPKKKPVGFFMNLQVLVVKSCHQLSVIVPPHMLPTLQSLESVTVEECDSVKEIFNLNKCSSPMQKILKLLRKLEVSSCISMQHVVATRDDNYTGATYHQTVIIPQLSSLSLSGLPNLGSFGHENHEIGLPSLSDLCISSCNVVEVLVADSNQDCKPLLLVKKVEFSRLKSMNIQNMQRLREIWHIGNEATHSECSSEAFCKLEFLTVIKCHKLLTVFPSKIIRAFHNLIEVSVSNCKSLGSLFESSGLRSGTELSSNNLNKRKENKKKQKKKNHDVVQTTFALSHLDLQDLPTMKQVWDVEDPRWAYLSFQKLYQIEVKNCDSLKHLFPASVAKRLLQLNELKICSCEGMEGIVYWNEESASACTPSSSDSTLMHSFELECPSLEKLVLQNCPNAKIFSPVQHKVSIPRLKAIYADARTLENSPFMEDIFASPTLSELTMTTGNKAFVEIIPWSLLVERFPNLRSFEIWDDDSEQIFPSSESDHYEKEGAAISYKSGIPDIFETLSINDCDNLILLLPSSAPFCNLTILLVNGCKGLPFLVTSSVARGLVQLTELRVSYCDNLEEIVRCEYDCNENGNRARDDDVADDVDTISFPHLTKLRLDNLPRLLSFSRTSYKFNFPSLIGVRLDEVSEMHVFCVGDFTTPYKHRITREIIAIRNKEIDGFEIPGTRWPN